VDLTEGDLIRNHVFMSISLDDQETFDGEVWRELELRFMTDGKLNGRDFQAFLRDALMRNGTYVGRDGTFETFEHRYPSGKFNPRTVVSDFVKAAKLYDLVRGSAPHESTDVQASLQSIRDLKATTAYPLIMALLEHEESKKLTREHLLLLLPGIAGFVLRRFICGHVSRAYSRWFVAACNELGTTPVESIL
jgi:hypothetical protein